MLVLSRKAAQTIIIDEEIEVTIVAMRRGCVKVGISAPRQVAIRRGELEPHAGSFPRSAAPAAPARLSVKAADDPLAVA